MSGAAGSMVTIRTAARLQRISVDTVKRRLAAGAYPGAVRVGVKVNSPWLIPVAALSGVAPGASTRADEQVQTVRTTASRSVPPANPGDVDDLRRELAVAQERARIFEAINERLLDILDRSRSRSDDAEEGQR